ncbi:AAA family ATPase [Natrialba sp. SSL1]|uniref:AAA family ATPase n=1 Tax=Natrialba sp. SSL1 TaxID=1869245 RepID=UPI0014957C81|nr:AAA family ATPase [Natrialba sp. SSL1]
MIELELEDINIDQHLPVRPTELGPSDQAVITDETEITFEQDVYIWSPARHSERSGSAYDDVGGLSREIELLREMVELPFEHPELFDRLNIDHPTGVLLHGPPGTGKTLLAEAVAETLDIEFIALDAPEIISQYRGVAQEALRDTFERARENAPAIIFIDEIDAIAPKRGDGDTQQSDTQLVAQLLTLMDGFDADDDVIVIAATNRIDSLDQALRRGGRFDREIEIGVPDEDERRDILEIHTQGMPLDSGVDLEDYAGRTHGFVGADLESLVTEAGLHALDRVKPEIESHDDHVPPSVLETIHVTVQDFDQGLTAVEPSSMREHTVEVPAVGWDDIGGLAETKAQLQEVAQWPLKFGEAYRTLDVEPPSGILLHGPPGTGKTLLAKAVANEIDSNFLAVNGPELMSKWVGESEGNVKEIFEQARANAPCVLFFDEIDAFLTERGQGSGNAGEVSDRMVSQYLSEMDGVDTLENVIVIGATNRLELLDEAVLRPGRFDYQINVSLPDRQAREKIFKVHTRDKPTSEEVNLGTLVEQTEGWSGAEIESVCREAAMVTFREVATSAPDTQIESEITSAKIEPAHFSEAMTIMEGGSVTDRRS